MRKKVYKRENKGTGTDFFFGVDRCGKKGGILARQALREHGGRREVQAMDGVNKSLL